MSIPENKRVDLNNVILIQKVAKNFKLFPDFYNVIKRDKLLRGVAFMHTYLRTTLHTNQEP